MNAVLCPRYPVSFPRANSASGHLAQQCLRGVTGCSFGPQNVVVHGKTPWIYSPFLQKMCLENTFRAESRQISAHYFLHKKLGIVLSKEKSSRLTFWQQRSFWFPGSSCFQARASWLLMLSRSMFMVVHLHSKYFWIYMTVWSGSDLWSAGTEQGIPMRILWAVRIFGS